MPGSEITPEALVRDHTVYSCVMGSRAFGLAVDGSDTDRRGVFLAPTPSQWRFAKPPTHVEGPAPEQFSWELERFCELALQSNPNILECLHSPLVEHVDDTGRELLALRGAFLFRRVYGTFTRYALSQRRRLEADVRHRGAPRWKHAMHLLRLLASCRDLLRTGELVVDAGGHRERLLAVRRGEVAWADAEAWMTRLAAEAEAALPSSPLPEEPDRERVEDFLFRTRLRSALGALSPPGAYDEVVQGVVRPRGVAG
ncbi:nucleotidyltransferase domain-containing protein [Streptomyces sudanensis]|uniref:nucleotidyltransferase domain-containing protein n=1 Tax=Streptomyces sudanensis TaxID=436397 RepID=UPI0020CDEEE1|nr:nucleotidyltransferase domain-containing protein [Streptomyces sudanensis]MCP9959530.1 nucleotidyltransferase domain-containing protein [Streptomyces sudanensis]MCP9988589.1 nucleotidyltransferase domain-containing protein [Streptomyces sudanensis]MCQ0000030.1 nucleotidyltransferase domain-containing protein [Streptomyces sudanensis]